MKSPRIAVIGASGKVARQVSHRPVALGHRPALISRQGAGLEALRGQAEVLNFSMLDVARLKQALTGAVASTNGCHTLGRHPVSLRRLADAASHRWRRAGLCTGLRIAGGEPAQGLHVPDSVDATQRAHHQPWWAARAHLLELAAFNAKAMAAYDQAIALAQSNVIRRALARRQLKLAGAVH